MEMHGPETSRQPSPSGSTVTEPDEAADIGTAAAESSQRPAKRHVAELNHPHAVPMRSRY